MPGLTRYVKNKVLEHIVGKTAFAMPTVYAALFTTNPTDDTGAGLVETSYSNYARVQTSAANWANAAASSIANQTAISFPTCGATGATVVGFGLYDAPTGGNLLAYGSSNLTVSTGIAPQFANGQLTGSLT